MTETPSRAPRAHKFHLHDTLTNTIVPLPQRKPGACSIYACGPTVYNFIHTGNGRPAVVFDTLVRHLRASGVDVTYVRNFTDIDDKIIRRSNEEQVDYRTIADRYIR